MYLFTRAGRLALGSIREAMTHVAEVTENVRQETGLDVHAWQASMSPELGTIVWATFVDSLEVLEGAQDKLAVSEGFLDLVVRGSSLWAGPLTDGLATVVHAGRDPEAPVPAYVSVARADAANGSVGAALAGGIEIAETATRITGLPTSFLVGTTGPFGGCAWTTGYADIGSLQQAETALNADEGWLQVIDRVGTAYAQGATQSIYRRIV